MATHTLLYHGPFRLNFASLASETTTYRDDPKSKQRSPVASPTKKVTDTGGLLFRYMRHTPRPEEDFVVGVGSVFLTAPVLLIHERHMDGKQFCADSPVYLGDVSAMRLLVDMIAANAAHRDTLGRLLVGLGKSARI